MEEEIATKVLHKTKTSDFIRLFEYMEEVSKIIGREKALEILEDINTRNRLDWLNKNKDKLNQNGEGNTPINVIDAIYTDASGVNQTLNVLKASVNQITHPVGGVASPVNKAEIIAPYIALAGLIAAVSTVYIIKKRRD